MDISFKGKSGEDTEYFCFDCGQLRLSRIKDKTKCYGCGSSNIKTGKVNELDKQKLKKEFYEPRQHNPND